MLYNFFSDNFEYDECTAKGSCSVPPSISALQEVLLICLRQLAYYVLKLRESGNDTRSEEEIIINGLATIVSTTDYSDEQLLNVVSDIYYHLLKGRKRYQECCKSQGVEYKELKHAINLSEKMNLSQIMALGEKAFLNKYKKTSMKQKNLTDILLAVVKSVSLNLSKLYSYSYNDEMLVANLLNALNLLNSPRHIPDKYEEQIKLLAHTDMLLTEVLLEKQKQNFGEVKLTEVSFSTSVGKSILVSGESLFDLKKLLEAAAGKNIDVYTHDELLIAHSFETFSKYQNLKGHYGTCNENCILDFATFPGAIFLTRNSNTNIEYLYRGRLFTTAKMLPQGVVPIKNDNFEELIKSAENAKGFAKGQERPSEVVGYNLEELKLEFANVAERLNSKELSHILVIGLSASKRGQKEYFQKLLTKLPKTVYILSFSLNLKHKNFMKINVANSRPLVMDVLKVLFEYIPINSDKLTFFLTRCDVSSLSNMINLREQGLKNIYLTQCPPNVINPAILNSLESLYGIKTTTIPEEDIKSLGI